MFKPNFKIGTFAPPQPTSSTGAAIGTEAQASTSSTTVGSSGGGPTASLPVEMNSKVAAAPPASAKDDDEIAEEVEYDEVSRFILCVET